MEIFISILIGATQRSKNLLPGNKFFPFSVASILKDFKDYGGKFVSAKFVSVTVRREKKIFWVYV